MGHTVSIRFALVWSLATGASLAAAADECPSGLGPAGQSIHWQGSEAWVAYATAPDGTRAYTLNTTQPLRDSLPESARVREHPGSPVLRSGNPLFDGLFALALDDARRDSVARIADANFPPADCRCFETGAKWTYVWTRDVSYAAALALSWVDPERMADTLLFKVSDHRLGAGGPEVVQDTGSGGAWPVSTDRVVWALGADEVQRYLRGAARQSFLDRAYPALLNTLASDDRAALAREDGLYRGETSFLDWREQSYPSWTKADVVPIGSGEALSTNALHAAALAVAGRWAARRGDLLQAARLTAAGETLRQRIDPAFWLPEQQLYGTYRIGAPTPALVPRADLLGEALAVLVGAAPPAHAAAALSTYPFTCAGPPVLWPEQPGEPIYHDRAIWPFVTAYWLKAAKRAGHGAVELPAVLSLVRAAALNLSNMENLEFVAGLPQLDLGQPDGGPVIDSQRQLWSVAGYLSMVVDVLFGKTASDAGLAFAPFITPELHRALFPETRLLTLAGFPYLGRRLDLEVELPDPGPLDDAPATDNRPYAVASLSVDGVRFPPGAVLPPAAFAPHSVVRVKLGSPRGDATSVTTLALTRRVPAPEAPATAPAERRITALRPLGGALELTVAPGPTPYTLLRDGEFLAAGLTAPTWVDRAPPAGRGVCYTVLATDRRTGFASQPGRTKCHWPAGTRELVKMSDPRFDLGGAATTVEDGVATLPGWGLPTDELVLRGYAPPRSATYRVQMTYRNAGPIDTGITACVKELVVLDHATGRVLATSAVVMPHTGLPPELPGGARSGAAAPWRGSTYSAPLAMRADRRYDLALRDLQNMSYFAHFAGYQQAGGAAGPRNLCDLAGLDVLAVSP